MFHLVHGTSPESIRIDPKKYINAPYMRSYDVKIDS